MRNIRGMRVSFLFVVVGVAVLEAAEESGWGVAGSSTVAAVCMAGLKRRKHENKRLESEVINRRYNWLFLLLISFKFLFLFGFWYVNCGEKYTTADMEIKDSLTFSSFLRWNNGSPSLFKISKQIP